MPNEDIWAMRDKPLEKAERAQSSDLGQKTRGRKKTGASSEISLIFCRSRRIRIPGNSIDHVCKPVSKKKREEGETK